MIRRGFALSFGVLVCAGATAWPEAVAIDHKAVGCIVVGKYPKMNACFSPAADLARSRVYFRPEGVPSWYYVDMKSDQPCFTGTLPKPGKKLVGKKIEYYLEAQNKTFEPARTAEFAPIVVRSAQECKKNVPVAPFLNNASVAVFPSVPAGFVGAGGIGTAAVIGIVGAGAAAAGTAAVVASNNNDNTTTTVVSSVNPTTTLAAPTTTLVTPTTTLASTNHAPFAVLTTNPDPPSGNGPLTVTFDLCKSTDPDKDPLSFFFDFGDGGKSSGSCNVTHTYAANFRGTANVRALDKSYAAEACVVDTGNLSACRSRTVNATTPPPACPAPTVVLSPPPALSIGCPAQPISVQASAANATGVKFCATPVDQSSCGFSPNPPSSNPPVCAAGSGSGTFSATLNVDPGTSDCYRINADATGCGGSASAAPAFTFNENNCFLATGARKDQERGVSWSSDLAVEGGRLQLVMNGDVPSFPGRGRATGVAKLLNGENRIEGVLVQGAGKAGLWRIDFEPGVVAEGSLRVISGDAVLLGASTATFRLSGREGERIVFTFLKK